MFHAALSSFAVVESDERTAERSAKLVSGLVVVVVGQSVGHSGIGVPCSCQLARTAVEVSLTSWASRALAWLPRGQDCH